MGKNILIGVTLLSLIACDPSKYIDHNEATWYIKNDLDCPIKVFKGGFANPLVIPPKDSIYIYHDYIYAYLGNPTFDLLYKNKYWYELDKQEQRIDISSENDELTKTWYAIEKDESGKQFFNEKYWKSYEIRKNVEYEWVFEITSDDLVSTPKIAKDNSLQ